MHIIIETNLYYNSHLKQPRGYGGWWFDLGNNGIDFMQFQFTGLYGDAKKAAKAKAREVGATLIRVLP